MDRAEDLLNSGNSLQLRRDNESQAGNQARREENADQSKPNVDGVPMKSSPYVKYSNLEDYKGQGYGTTGHLPVNPNQTPGATDAPTPSGAGATPTLAGEGGQSS
ncbi:unnamed protein product [Linum trigynum]|uniref:Uncharacterized protein n=1 Tax=Linum trigynum TaxID=586398 RepID=A0AAV2CG48_9ROSI